jgi:hypothetical protein
MTIKIIDITKNPLQRIINSTELKKNDVCDTFGYLALLMIDKGWLTFEEMLD